MRADVCLQHHITRVVRNHHFDCSSWKGNLPFTPCTAGAGATATTSYKLCIHLSTHHGDVKSKQTADATRDIIWRYRCRIIQIPPCAATLTVLRYALVLCLDYIFCILFLFKTTIEIHYHCQWYKISQSLLFTRTWRKREREKVIKNGYSAIQYDMFQLWNHR